MALHVTFSGARDGDDGPFQLASASGWQAAMKTASGAGKAIDALFADGAVTNSTKLAKDLDKALAMKLPKDVHDTLAQLRELVGSGDEQETVSVID
jgi:hypothetical protein